MHCFSISYWFMCCVCLTIKKELSYSLGVKVSHASLKNVVILCYWSTSWDFIFILLLSRRLFISFWVLLQQTCFGVTQSTNNPDDLLLYWWKKAGLYWCWVLSEVPWSNILTDKSWLCGIALWKGVVGWPCLDIRCPPSALSFPSSAGPVGEENKMEKNSWVKIKAI